MPYFMQVRDREPTHTWHWTVADGWSDRFNALARSAVRVIAVSPIASAAGFVFGIACRGDARCVARLVEDARQAFPGLDIGDYATERPADAGASPADVPPGARAGIGP